MSTCNKNYCVIYSKLKIFQSFLFDSVKLTFNSFYSAFIFKKNFLNFHLFDFLTPKLRHDKTPLSFLFLKNLTCASVLMKHCTHHFITLVLCDGQTFHLSKTRIKFNKNTFESVGTVKYSTCAHIYIAIYRINFESNVFSKKKNVCVYISCNTTSTRQK